MTRQRTVNVCSWISLTVLDLLSPPSRWHDVFFFALLLYLLLYLLLHFRLLDLITQVDFGWTNRLGSSTEHSRPD